MLDGDSRRMQDGAAQVLLSFPPPSGNLLMYVKMLRDSVGTARNLGVMCAEQCLSLPRHSERQRREESSDIFFDAILF
jgi:hypothetical protein